MSLKPLRADIFTAIPPEKVYIKKNEIKRNYSKMSRICGQGRENRTFQGALALLNAKHENPN